MATGDDPPSRINIVVEIPKGSNVKYEIDAETGFVFVDRFLYTATHYPFNYGFVPNTRAEDGDFLDALVITEESIYPTCVIRARTVGALLTEDEKGRDAKLITVPDRKVDPSFSFVSSIDQLPKFTLKQIEHFFTHYKESESGKFVKQLRWQNKNFAERLVNQAIISFSR